MRHAGFRVRIQDREIELIFARVEVDEKVVDLVEHGGRARVGAVNFIENNDRRKLGLQRLLQHIAGLRQRTFAGVDQQQHAVHHAQGALDFAAEIAVAGRVHDVDARIVKEKRRVLGQNGDSALAFELVRVHHAVDHSFIAAKDAALAEHGIHQRRLAVVHVRDDGDIADRRIADRGILNGGLARVVGHFGTHFRLFS